jgi:uncharacterized membrane protein YkoI
MRQTVVGTGIAVLALAVSGANAFDLPETEVTLEQRLQAAVAIKSGDVRKVELEVEDGRAIYQELEVHVDACTAEILSSERESNEKTICRIGTT